MAKEIFISTNTGKLVKIKNESTGNTPALIQMGTKTGGVKSTDKATFPALITSFSIQLETMHTFARSLSDVFYVYPFGDKPTEITVACLVMSDGECDNGVLSYSDTLAQLVDFYKSNRISNKNKLSIIEVVVGSQALKINGLITRMSIVGQMPAGIPALQVTFNLIGWLEDISSGSGSASGGSSTATSARPAAEVSSGSFDLKTKDGTTKTFTTETFPKTFGEYVKVMGYAKSSPSYTKPVVNQVNRTK